jgi:hypothetical protein
LAGGLNLYGYAGGDPINFSDPFGLYPVCVMGPVGALVCISAAALPAITITAAAASAERSGIESLFASTAQFAKRQGMTVVGWLTLAVMQASNLFGNLFPSKEPCQPGTIHPAPVERPKLQEGVDTMPQGPKVHSVWKDPCAPALR